MWFRKPKLLVCVGCGCLMRKARKMVELEDRTGFPAGPGGSFVFYTGTHYSTESYCGICAPAYDIRRVSEKVRFYRKEPAKNIEVNEKGKESR